MRDRLPALLVPALAVLAGCLAPAQTVTPEGLGEPLAPAWRFADFIVDDHEHNVVADHAVASPNLAQVAHHVLGEDGKPLSYIGELDSRAGLTAVAVVARGSTPGFVLLDTRDPAAPQVLGRAEAPWAYGADVKLTDDGAFALLATQGRGPFDSLLRLPTPGELPDAYLARSGIAVFDLADAAQPRLVHTALVEPTGCHMISIGRVAGAEHVFCINEALTILRFERAAPPRLVPVGAYWPLPPQGYDRPLAGAVGGLAPHDVTFQLDPLDGTPLAVVSHWDLGVAVLDVTDPAQPRELFRWAGEGAAEYHGFTHSAQVAKVGERRILVASPETLRDVLPAMWFLDVTDWASGALVAEWVNPGRHSSQGLLMTTHQWQVVGERLYLAYNHNGVWVLDVPTILANGGGAPGSAEVVGVFLPHDEVELFDAEAAVTPNVWDLNVVQGHILATDRYTGLHVLRLDGDPATPAFSSWA